jgi:tetratricopeptide (TPR) repeat protein
MSQTCPTCQKQLKGFAVGCPYCGWNVAENNQGVPPADLPDRAPSSTDHLDAIDEGNFPVALELLNKAILHGTDDELGELYSLRGYVHLKLGEYEKAENDCDQAISRHHNQPQTLAWRAASRGEQDKWRSAFDDLAKAYETSTRDRDQYLQLMQAYSESARDFFQEQITAGNDGPDIFFDRAWVYLKAGKLNKAERDFQQTLDRQSDHSGAAVGLAELKFDQHEYESAMDLAERACEDETWKRKALEIHARAAHELGRPQACFKDLKKLRKLVGQDSRLAYQCGVIRSSLGDHVGAIADLTHAYSANQFNFPSLLKRADCYSAIKNFPLAELDYISYIRSNPEDADAYARLGQVYLMQKRLNQALETFDLALAKDEVCFEAFLGRSKAFLEKKQYDQALTECDKAIRLDNTRADVFGVRAQIRFGLCQYSDAIEDFSRSIEKSPSDQERASQLYRRGTAYFELNQIDKAIDDFDSATTLCPNHAGTWIWRAAGCARLEQFSEAIISLQNAIAVRPSSAQQYHAMGKPVAEAAIEYFSHRLQRGHADDPQAYSDRALAHSFLGNIDSAIEDYTKALSKNPGDANTLIRRAQMLAQQGDHESAIDDYTKVIRKDPANHWARYCRALSRSSSGQVDEANSDILKSIKLAPKHPRYHVLNSEILQKKKEFARAIKAYDKAIALDSHDPSLYARRGAALMSQRHYLKSIYDFTRSIELLPNQASILISRGQAFLKLEQGTSARRDFESALGMDELAIKAYTGRAASLVMMNEHESALIFLTKAFHRFDNPRELAELLLERGKHFYKMGRFGPAIGDFTSLIELLRDQRPAAVGAARYARGLALVQHGELEPAKRDFRKCLSALPKHVGAAQALEHLTHGKGAAPSVLQAPPEPIRPTRPPVLSGPSELIQNGEDQFINEAPFDTWILRTEDRKEYGPVKKSILDQWVKEGRLDETMRLMRADWTKWKRISKVYPQFLPPAAAFESLDDVSLIPKPSIEDPDMDVPEIGSGQAQFSGIEFPKLDLDGN